MTTFIAASYIGDVPVAENEVRMKLIVNPDLTFLVRVIHLRNPKLNGWPAIGIMGARLTGFTSDDSFLAGLSLFGVIKERVVSGKLFEHRVIEQEGEEPILQVLVPPRQQFLVGWTNARELFGRPVGSLREAKFSALFSIQATKKEITRIRTVRLVATDERGEKIEAACRIHDHVRKGFMEKDITLPPD